MGNKIFIFLILLVLNFNSFSQCKQQLVYSCAAIDDESIYLDDFNAHFDKNNLERSYSFYLKSGTRYQLAVCYPDGYDCELELYNSDSVLVAKSSDYNELRLDVDKSELYYVKMIAEKNTKCAVCVLSFLGKAHK